VLGLPCRISEACFAQFIKNRRNHALHDHVNDASWDPAVPVIVSEIADARASDALVVSGVDGLDDVSGHKRDCTLKVLLWRARRINDTAIEEDILLRSLAFNVTDCCTKTIAPIAVGKRVGAASRIVVDLVASVDADESCTFDARFIPHVTIIGVLENIKENLRSDVFEKGVADKLQTKHIRATSLLHID